MHGHSYFWDLIEYAFVGVYLSIRKFMGEYLNESRNVIY